MRERCILSDILASISTQVRLNRGPNKPGNNIQAKAEITDEKLTMVIEDTDAFFVRWSLIIIKKVLLV